MYLNVHAEPSESSIIVCKIGVSLTLRGDQAHTMRRSARLIQIQMGGVKKHAREGVVKASEMWVDYFEHFTAIPRRQTCNLTMFRCLDHVFLQVK